MELKPEELEENGYVLLDQLDHRELVHFIRIYLKKRTRYSVFYYCCNLLLFAAAGYLLVAGVPGVPSGFGHRFTHFGYGLAFTFSLIPLHEYIHVLAYRWQGARHTSLDVNLKKLYFLALAYRFVADKREFQRVAMAPFGLISLLLTGLLFVVPSDWIITVVATLLTHTAMCSGDFGLLSYIEWHAKKDPVTYDDVVAKMSYFYGKKETA